ncbi:MAG: hypothetical protein GY845_30395 [Planctomycetes bacterium]|nr:hypothetical protein [Planctomycetota bacterium]
MSGPITTSSFAKDLMPGVNKFYGLEYAKHPEEAKDIFDSFKSTKAFEEEVGISGLGLAPLKTEGNGITYDVMKQGFISRYTHFTYGLGFIITREMWEDGIAIPAAIRRAKALAFSLRTTDETVAANVLNRAFTSTYTGGDGKELCSTVHPNKAGGTWSNEPTTPADLSEVSLEQACIDIGGFTNDRGLPVAIKPQSLIIPSELQFDAERLLKSSLQPGTANNDLNAVKSAGSFPGGAKANHYLTDADAWFVKTNCPDGLKCFVRRSPEFGTDNDFDTENAKFKATFRKSYGWTDPRGIYGSPGN